MNSFDQRLPQQAPSRTAPLFAGVELGGTKCVCTLAYGPEAILEQQTITTEEPDTTLAAIKAVLQRWHQSDGFAALGIASFGPVDLDPNSPDHGRILATTKPDWPGTNVCCRLSAALDVPCGFDTDVNGAALGEMRWGAGRGLQDFAYITVGTGVGVGLVVHGRPTRGIGHSEIGHMRVPRIAGDDFTSVCRFHANCVEGLASGSAVKAAVGAEHLSAIGSDHPVWARVSGALACLCHALMCSTGPWRIAIGGGVMVRQPHLLERIERELRASLNGYMRLPEAPIVVAPELGDQAGPLGSIALAAAALA